jgi:hypothetical protein
MTDPADRLRKKATFVTQAPPPFRPLGGSSLPRQPKPTAVLDYLPLHYPASLAPDTLLVICKAAKKFPVQTLIAELCKYVITMLKPHYRRAILEKTLRQDMALSEMDGLLHYLLAKNCESDSRRYELKNEVMRSEEWLRLVKTIAGLRGRSSPKPSRKRSRTEKSQRMAKAQKSIQFIWKQHRTATHKDIIKYADKSKIEVPWSTFTNWSSAWADKEGPVRTFLSKAKKASFPTKAVF